LAFSREPVILSARLAVRHPQLRRCSAERGRVGYKKCRKDFARLIWHIASPTWKFDDATFDRSAASFDNPDHVAVVIHNYRWRLGLADGERKYAGAWRSQPPHFRR